ncbi:hypothetical protein LLG95_15545 [bacterium]|nr:hypothetical protein [bacterium]
MPTENGRPILRFMDMFFPDRLLDRTGCSDNPLVNYIGRLSATRSRYITNRLFQLCLLLFVVLTYTPFVHKGFFLPILSIPFFSFVALRYHLFTRNHYAVIKLLSSDRVPELLLTELGDDELFLHFFLLHCRKLGWLVGIIPLWSLALMPTLSMDLLGEAMAILFLFSLIFIQTKIAAAYQFALEWKWFAGRPQNKAHAAFSNAISIVFAVLILFANICIETSLKSSVEAILLPVMIALAMSAALLFIVPYIRRIHENATAWAGRCIERRLIPEAYRVRALDLLYPRRWVNPFSHRADHLPAGKKFGLVMDGILYGVFFSIVLFVFTILGYYITNNDQFNHDYTPIALASILLPMFILIATGIYHGESIAMEERPMRPDRIQRTLSRLGVVAIAVAAMSRGLDPVGAPSDYLQLFIGFFNNYVLNVTYCLIAMTCGVTIASQRRYLANLSLVAITIYAATFLAVYKVSDVGAAAVRHSINMSFDILGYILGGLPGIKNFSRLLEILAPLACYWIIFKLSLPTLRKLYADADPSDHR